MKILVWTNINQSNNIMKYFSEHKNFLLISAAFGFVIALIFRLYTPVIITTDFEMVYRNSVSISGQQEFLISQRKLRDLNERNLGKEVFGMGGFPISSYTDCVVRIPTGGEGGASVFAPVPICNRSSAFGEFAIFLNAIFWAFLVYLVLLSLKNVRRKILGNKK
jgi:hypothetical protein